MVKRNMTTCKIEHASFIHSSSRPGAPVEYVVKLEDFIRVTLRPDSFIRTVSLFSEENGGKKHIMNNE
jgi:hypothetical protein